MYVCFFINMVIHITKTQYSLRFFKKINSTYDSLKKQNLITLNYFTQFFLQHNFEACSGLVTENSC